MCEREKERTFIIESQTGSLGLWGCRVVVWESFLNVFDERNPDGAGTLICRTMSSVVCGWTKPLLPRLGPGVGWEIRTLCARKR